MNKIKKDNQAPHKRHERSEVAFGWGLIIIRPAPHLPIGHFRLGVVPFGVTTAPFIACRTLQKLADDEESRFPEAASVLKTRFYVDDLSTSVHDIDTAKQLYQQLIQLLDSAGFQLRKWATNDPELLSLIPEDHKESAAVVEMDESTAIKTLGLNWSPATDAFNFTCNPDMERTHTKRNILSETSKVFDPLGLISPITIKSKILMQKIWKNNLGWDDQLPEEISIEWNKLSLALTTLNLKPISRALRTTTQGTWELHAFADASQDAYAATVYIREMTGESITANLVASKTRVAPLKPLLTIPRLELQAAVLAIDLVEKIKETLSAPISKIYYWTDSAITLHWVKASPIKWKLFVRNRVSAIQEKSDPEQWAHVISEENPADCASRGLYPDELRDFDLWWSGPDWLKRPFIFQPPLPGMPQEVELEPATAVAATITEPIAFSPLQQFTRIGSWHKSIRVIARVVSIFTARSFKCSHIYPNLGLAEAILVRFVQQEAFPELLADPTLVEKRGLVKGIRSLRPFVDDDGTLRVGGRLGQAELPHATRHPWILPGTQELVRTLIMEIHTSLMHAGKRVILNHLRQRYWLLNGTKHIKSTIDKCLICFRYHAQPEMQRMGQLPSARVSLVRPFLHTGVDFAGPYQLKNFTGRGGQFKVWICLFTCMATRAIHLEIVSSLSAEGFLNAFKRFIARRGKPSHMYSDNGTNFVGANHHLEDHLEYFRSAFSKGESSPLGLDLNKIQWSFSPPTGPHHGGAWEICVKLVKQHLRTQTLDTTHNWEQFETLLLCIEAIVNSRPLTPMDDDPESLEVLTPAHFLIGSSLTMIPEADLSHLKWNRLSQYQILTRQHQALWRRWHQEYLLELQRMKKWTSEKANLQVGDLVLLMDDLLPPLKWRTGRVKAVHPGSDQLVRVVTTEVATASNNSPEDYVCKKKDVVRPITKLAKLPLDKEAVAHGPGLNLIRPHTRTNLATWLVCGVLLALSTPANAQAPTQLSPEASVWVAFFALMLAVVGTLMNGFTLYRIMHQTLITSGVKQKSSYPWCAFCLALSDMVITSFLIPLSAARYFFRAWMFGLTLCRLYSLALYGTVTWVLFNLMFIAAFRYYKISRPLPSQPMYFRRMLAMAGLLFGLSFLLPTLAFLDLWGTIAVKPSDPSVCTILPDTAGRSPKPLIWIIGVFIPFTIIYTASIVIYCQVQRHRKTSMAVKRSSQPLARLRRTIFLVLVTFLVGYQPILVLNTVDNEKTRLPVFLHLCSMFLAWLTTLFHPWIYFSNPRTQKRVFFAPPPKMRSLPTQEEKDSMPIFYVSTPSLSTTEDSKEYLTTSIPMATASLPSAFRMHKGQRHKRTLAASALMATIIALCVSPCPSEAEEVAQISSAPVLRLTDIMANWSTLPTTVPLAILKLPPCAGYQAPLSPVPACVHPAHWLGIHRDASVCVHTTDCSDPAQSLLADGSSCVPSPATCAGYVQAKFIDPLSCQSRPTPTLPIPPHIILKDVTPSYCSAGNIHLRNCDHFKEVIQTIPVLLVNGILYPVTELNMSEDAALSDISSYNCSCPKSTCLRKGCHGDSTFCQHIGCVTDMETSPASCYCQYTNREMIHVFHTPNNTLIPDCWGHLPMVLKLATKNTKAPIPCDGCSISCKEMGMELHTPDKIPKYKKVTKNPGFVSMLPSSDTTFIKLTAHMLIASGPAFIEIWFPEADRPIMLQQTCPRLNVCQVITCHICYDRWVNIPCYGWINWAILAVLICTLTTMVIVARQCVRTVCAITKVLTWPCRTLWRRRQFTLRSNRRNDVEDEEKGYPLLPMESPKPYQTTTTRTTPRRPRNTGFQYRGPLTFIITLIAISLTSVTGCSEFASMSASATECRQGEGSETCTLQFSTRLAVSPIGQRSCFKIANHQQKTLGTIEVETRSVTVVCDKQLLYFVPRSQISCQSHLQCYSLYSSSDCHGDKCVNFKTNDTIKALASTKDSLGWSTCLDIRVPTCPFWLTRDCHFVRMALVNPSQVTYEVFNCPTWKYAVSLNVTTHLGGKSTSQSITLQTGKEELIQNISFSVISASIPPSPVLSRCFLQQERRVALVPCNEEGEVTMGRIGEIQCPSIEAAEAVSSSCSAIPGLIMGRIDSMGVKCSGELVDPELLMENHALPLRLDEGVITATFNSTTVQLDTSHVSLLELQLTAKDLDLVAEINNGKCDATFIKIEGCYSCLSGATLFIQAKTDSITPMTATLECPNNLIYTQLVVSNISHYFQQVVMLNIPDVDAQCQFKCAMNTVPLHIKGHLHYLSTPNFLSHSDVISHHGVTAGGLDFHWLSIIGSNISSWITRGLIGTGVICGTLFLMFVGFRWSHQKRD